MTDYELKVLRSTVNQEIPIITLLDVAVKLGEILDVTTTYHPEDYTKTITIRYYPYVYQGTTPAPAPAPMTTPQQEPLAPSRVSPTTPSQQPEAEDTDNQCNTQTNDDQNDRIFCTIPPSFPTSSIVQKLLQYFSPYGRIEYYNIIKNKQQKPTFAFIKYFNSTHAKRAYENVDKIWKAVMAEERKIKSQYRGKTIMTLHKECETQVEWDTYALHVTSCEQIRNLEKDPITTPNTEDCDLINLV
ncbi:unnamed protein product [Trichogramma brassicae]|uniref:RRM domain-containing protein n=1 Tax=Trichogramma brassicae TaxID=86971 RepID=A0A6H5IUU1_9HYME|nr:unnamed protein product [Trichogramma brassicae]